MKHAANFLRECAVLDVQWLETLRPTLSGAWLTFQHSGYHLPLSPGPRQPERPVCHSATDLLVTNQARLWGQSIPSATLSEGGLSSLCPEALSPGAPGQGTRRQRCQSSAGCPHSTLAVGTSPPTPGHGAHKQMSSWGTWLYCMLARTLEGPMQQSGCSSLQSPTPRFSTPSGQRRGRSHFSGAPTRCLTEV